MIDKILNIGIGGFESPEELLGAYLEGNLNSEETSKIEQYIEGEPDWEDFISGVELMIDWDQTLDNITIETFELPEIDNREDLFNEDVENSSELGIDDLEIDSPYDFEDTDFDDALNNSEMDENSDNQQIDSPEEQTLYGKEVIENNCITNLKAKNNMGNSNQLGTSHFGETGQNFYDPIFIRQPDDHSCALRSQQIILRDFGIDIPFQDLEKLALDYGVYSENGTSMYDVGKVLELAGVGMHQVEGSNMLDLTNELSKGHRVIVGVDADELWYNDKFADKVKNWFNDRFADQGGNHAVIVAGVDVNPNNPNDVKVILTDPGSGELRVEYPMEKFMDAWKDTNCFMAATDNPAPYQYDPTTGMEIPSNFVIEQHFNQFVAENSYQLAPDLINVPADYQPVYSEHLDYVGDMTYADFNDKYADYKETQQMFASAQSSEEQNGAQGEKTIPTLSPHGHDDDEEKDDGGGRDENNDGEDDEEDDDEGHDDDNDGEDDEEDDNEDHDDDNNDDDEL